jgi:ABC-type molybdate transport system ATPase subunit
MNPSFSLRYGYVSQGKKIFSKIIVKKNKLYTLKASTFPHPPKKLQKITMKIDIMGSWANFQLSPAWTLVL